MRNAIKLGVSSALLVFFFAAPVARVEADYSLPPPPPRPLYIVVSDCSTQTVLVTHWEFLGYYVLGIGYQYVLTRIPHCE